MEELVAIGLALVRIYHCYKFWTAENILALFCKGSMVPFRVINWDNGDQEKSNQYFPCASNQLLKVYFLLFVNIVNKCNKNIWGGGGGGCTRLQNIVFCDP